MLPFRKSTGSRSSASIFLSRSSHPLPLLLLATSPSCSGHKTIRVGDLYKLDVVCRKMLRMIVGGRNFVEWNAPWHHSLHHWNGAYKVAHGHSFHKNGQVSVLNKIPAAIDSLYTHCLPQNDGCPSGTSQAMISVDKFDINAVLSSHHASHH